MLKSLSNLKPALRNAECQIENMVVLWAMYGNTKVQLTGLDNKRRNALFMSRPRRHPGRRVASSSCYVCSKLLSLLCSSRHIHEACKTADSVSTCSPQLIPFQEHCRKWNKWGESSGGGKSLLVLKGLSSEFISKESPSVERQQQQKGRRQKACLHARHRCFALSLFCESLFDPCCGVTVLSRRKSLVDEQLNWWDCCGGWGVLPTGEVPCSHRLFRLWPALPVTWPQQRRRTGSLCRNSNALTKIQPDQCSSRVKPLTASNTLGFFCQKPNARSTENPKPWSTVNARFLVLMFLHAIRTLNDVEMVTTTWYLTNEKNNWSLLMCWGEHFFWGF